MKRRLAIIFLVNVFIITSCKYRENKDYVYRYNYDKEIDQEVIIRVVHGYKIEPYIISGEGSNKTTYVKIIPTILEKKSGNIFYYPEIECSNWDYCLTKEIKLYKCGKYLIPFGDDEFTINKVNTKIIRNRWCKV